MTWRASLDAWKTDADADAPDREAAEARAYRCLDCGWRGRGGIAAFDHHRSATPHHRIAHRTQPTWIARFSCCTSGGLP